MKHKPNPNSMTLTQFLLFLVIGGIAVVWLLLFEISPRLHYGDPLYPVDDYAHLKSELASNTKLLLPDETVLPSGDHINFFACESTRKKLDPQRDGYRIAVIGDGYGYAIACSLNLDSIYPDAAPEDIRPDYSFYGVSVMRSDGPEPQLRFTADGYCYSITASGSAIPADAMDTLLNIADNMLRQAG